MLSEQRSSGKQSLYLLNSLGVFSCLVFLRVVVTAVVLAVFSAKVLFAVLTSSALVSSPFAGGSTPPGITAPAVPSIPSPIGVNGFTGLPPQANGQPAAEAVFANGIHPYPGKPDQSCAHSLLPQS